VPLVSRTAIAAKLAGVTLELADEYGPVPKDVTAATLNM